MIKLAILLFALITPTFTICPDHGVKSAFTGNRRSVAVMGRFVHSCEFEHPLDTGGEHKFWSECD